MSWDLATLIVQIALAAIVVVTTVLIARMNRVTRANTMLVVNDVLAAYRELSDRVREIERQNENARDG